MDGAHMLGVLGEFGFYFGTSLGVCCASYQELAQ